MYPTELVLFDMIVQCLIHHFICVLTCAICFQMVSSQHFQLHATELCNAFQNLDVNSLSQSEIISDSKLFSQYNLSKNRHASFLGVMSVWEATSWMLLPKQSVKVIMQLLLSSSGSSPINSMATESPCLSGTVRGCNRPYGFIVDDLLHWKLGQEGT